METYRRVQQVNIITVCMGFLIISMISAYNIVEYGIGSFNVIAFSVSIVVFFYTFVRANSLADKE